MAAGVTLEEARSAVRCASEVIATAVEHYKSQGQAAHDDQVGLYELSHAAAGVAICEVGLDYAALGEVEHQLAMVFIGRTVSQLGATVWACAPRWGVEPKALEPARQFATAATSGDFVAEVADQNGPRHLGEDLRLVADTFRRFADERIAPYAERIHRQDLDIPSEIIDGAAALGCFGLSIPEAYGGFAQGTPDDLVAMVIATEELSRASLGAGGSLITRPEILARALESGGTEAQKRRWLPRIATGETLCGVAVTEPDHGSDVAGIKVSATEVEGGYILNGTKTWCTFAGKASALMVLARTNPDTAVGHRGLSILIVEKPSDKGHEFCHRASGGTLEGRAIATLGYRGMHSYEVSLSDWFVPADNLIGGAAGVGRGFYLQMAGFENGRLQTAARALGLMQRSYELAAAYARERRVFRKPLSDFQLTRVKLATMASLVAVGRQYVYRVARRLGSRSGALQAAMAKAFMCKAAEWVTREAMQIHGGYGYAEEYEISRLFVDARVLSIFEGADETLCLKLIARRLLA